jgi:SAM-dependent methyltransferase
MSRVSPQEFYDQMAGSYHLIFADWQASVRRQGEIFDRLFRAELGYGPEAGRPVTVLDCSCGIGTQSIGLALQGYTVHATDISPASVARVSEEAARADVSITTGIADFRALADQVDGQFDLVITIDNALPHLLSDDDMQVAANNLASKVKAGGLLAASIRDYDTLRQERPQFNSERVIDGADGRRITFQMWEWPADGQTYTVNQFILQDRDDGWQTAHFSTEYRALTRSELEGFLGSAGFEQIHWNMTDFYQPVVLARLAQSD